MPIYGHMTLSSAENGLLGNAAMGNLPWIMPLYGNLPMLYALLWQSDNVVCPNPNLEMP